jgi:hypothetical protein
MTREIGKASWSGAIRETKRQLVLAELRVEQLRGALKIFERNKRSREPFPGEPLAPETKGESQ